MLLLLAFGSTFGMRAGLFFGRKSGLFARGIDEIDAEADAEQSQGVIPGEKSFAQEDAGEHRPENGSEEAVDGDFAGRIVAQ